MTSLNQSDILKALRQAKGTRSLRVFAAELDISFGYLSDVLRGNRAPGPKILKKMGLRQETTYQTAKIGGRK